MGGAEGGGMAAWIFRLFFLEGLAGRYGGGEIQTLSRRIQRGIQTDRKGRIEKNSLFCLPNPSGNCSTKQSVFPRREMVGKWPASRQPPAASGQEAAGRSFPARPPFGVARILGEGEAGSSRSSTEICRNERKERKERNHRQPPESRRKAGAGKGGINDY